jgi:hypothetical protein
MRVTVSRAYIAGIGTTGVLIGFALLILAVVSAIVAFRGWPGDAVVDGDGSVTIGEGAGLVNIAPVSFGERATAILAGATTRAGAASPGSSVAGGRFDVRGVSRSEGARLRPGSAPVEEPGAAGSPSAQPNAERGGGGGVGGIGGGVGGGGGGGVGGVTQDPAGTVEETVGPVTDALPDAGGVVGDSVPSLEDVQQKVGELPSP